MAEDLRSKAVGGTKWALLGSYSGQVISAISSYTLSRLVLPNDWGILTAAMVTINIIRSCGNFGVNYALVQWRGDVRRAAPTALTLMLGIGVVAFGAVLCVAPFTKGYFQHPAVPLLTVLLALILFLKPASIVAEGTMRREFKLRTIFAVEFLSHFLSAAGAIVAAALLPESKRYWALAFGGLAWEVLRTLFSWWLTNVPLRLGFDRQVAKDLLHYCKFFLGSSILMSLYLSLDQLVIGKAKGTESLGLYGFALQWVGPLGIASAAVFGGVALPVYARLQDDKARLLTSYCRILTYSALISTGLLTGLVTVIPEAVKLALRPEYRPTIPIFQVLGLYWIVRAIDNTTGQLFAGIGKPKYDLYLNAANLAAMAVPMVPLVRYAGPVGAGYALLFARLVRFALNAVFCRRALGCSLAPLAKSLVPAVAASGAMAAVLWGIKAVFPHVGGIVGWARLGALVAIGAGVFLGVLYGLYRTLFREMLGLVRDALVPKKKSADS